MQEYPIIDAHAHLGDVLNHNGGALIAKTGIPDRNISDRALRGSDILDPAQWAVWGSFNHGGGRNKVANSVMEVLNPLNVKAANKRNGSATLENCMTSMQAAGVDYQITLPIPPYLTFDNLKGVDHGIIPFTGVDFTKDETDNEFGDRIRKQFAQDIENGAKGLKIHPILQVIPLVSTRVSIVMEEFARYHLPMLSHAGHANYYSLSDTDAGKKQAPEHGLDIEAFAELAKAFPESPIIVGHSGITSVYEVIEKLATYQNVHVDTSFQGTEYIKALIQAFGEDRVLWASDWPFGARSGQKKVMEKVCAGKPDLRKKVFFTNANGLMKLGL